MDIKRKQKKWQIVIDSVVIIINIFQIIFQVRTDTFSVSDTIFSILGDSVIILLNHLLTYFILKLIIRIEITGEYVHFLNIDGKTYTCRQGEVKSIISRENGYKIVLDKKKLYVNRNYHDVTVINKNDSHEGILYTDFPFAIYEME